MTTITNPTVTTDAPARRGALPDWVRVWVPRVLLYIFLTGVAYLLIFPFLYMMFTSLKNTDDVFTYPPRLLPYDAVTQTVDGEERALYSLEVDGQERTMALVEEGVRFGYFGTAEQINTEDPRASTGLFAAPLDAQTEAGEAITVGEDDYDVYNVTLADGTVQPLALVYRTSLGRFVDVNDPAVETYANVRTAPPAERVAPQWGNYQAVLDLRNLDRALVNSAIVTVFVTLGQVVTSLLGGYAFSRMRFRGRNMVFLVYLGTIMIPFVVLIIPLYQLMVIIGWQDHLVALILPWLFTAYGTFLMRQFFITIPKELEEAALLDGVSRLGILWRIFIPLSGPAIATQTIITFLYAWNSFIWPLIIINEGTVENHVVTLALNQLRNVAASEPNLVLTGAAIAVLPPMIIFLFAQRYFIEGIATSGLKG